MKHNLLASLFTGGAMLCCMTTPVFAEDTETATDVSYHLQVVHTDGSEVKVPFSDRPEITYTGSALKLTTPEMEVEYPEGALDYFTIVEETGISGIKDIATESGEAKSVINDKCIIFTGGTPGAVLTVVSVNGVVVAKGILDSEGSAVIPFSPEKGGVYIINSGKTTFKIIKK